MAAVTEHRGAILRARRREVGFASMAACAAASSALAARDPASFRSFSRSSLNSWELDPSGESLEAAHGRAVRTLSYLLQWSATDFSAYLGIPIGAVPRRRLQLEGPSGEQATPTVERPYSGGVQVRIQLGAAPQASGWSLDPDLPQGATVIAEPGPCPPGDLAVVRLGDRQLIVVRLAADPERQPALFEGAGNDAPYLRMEDAKVLARVVQMGGEEG